MKRWLAIGCVATVFALSGVMATRLRMDEDITAMLPDSDPAVSDYHLVISRFHAIDAVYIDIGSAADGPEAPTHVAAVADALHGRLRASGLFRTLTYRIPPERFLEALGKLAGARSRLLSDRGLAEVEARLSAREVRRRLGDAKRMLMEPSGPFVRDRLRRDPLGLEEIVVAPLKDFAREGGAAQVLDGRLWSEDARHLLMIAVPYIPAMDTRRGEGLMAAFEQARAEALRAAPEGSVRISFVGGHRAALENAGTVKSDVQRTLLATSLGILALAVLFFRRWLFISLVFLPAAFGMACSMLAFELFDPLISAVAIGCGAVLLGISVDCGVHILYRLDHPEGEPIEPVPCVRGMLAPLAQTSFTTIAGLLCLLFSSVPGQRQTGLFASVGMLGSFVGAVLVLPHLLPRRLRPSRRRVVPLASWSGAFLAWRAHHEKLVGAILLAALIIGGVGLSRLRFAGSVESLNYMTAGHREDAELIRTVWGELPSTAVVTRGPTLEDALEANGRLHAELLKLADEGQVASVFSIAPLLPSRKTQAANLERWKAFWSSERLAATRAEVAAAAGALGFSERAFQPFFDALGSEGPPLRLEDFDDTGLDRLVRSRIASDDGQFMVMTTCSVADDAKLPAVVARIRAALPDAVVTNGRAFAAHIAHSVRDGLTTLSVTAGLAMVLCLYPLLGRIELVLTTLLPVCLSTVFSLGVMGLLGIPINLLSSLFVVFVFGVGIDYSIFSLDGALDRYRGGPGHDASNAGSVVISALTTLLGFVTLACAQHPALFSIGITGTVGMASSLAFSVLLVPAIARRLLPAGGRAGAPSLKTLGGALWAYAYLAGMALLYLGLLRPGVFLLHPRHLAARQRFARKFLRTMAAGLLRFFPYRDSDRLYLGADPAAFQPPAVIVSNHLAVFDILAVLALPTQMVMLVKDWVWRAPIVGRIIRDAGYMRMAEGEPEAFLSRGAEWLAQGVSVMVFPEATRSPDGRMHRFHKGAFELAVRTGSEVIPVLLSNTQACTPRNSLWVGDHRTVIHVLPRVTPRTFDHAQGGRELARHVKAKLLAHVDEDWRLAQQGRAFRHNIRSLYSYRGAYAEHYIAWKLRIDPIFEHADEFVPREGLVLDLGCGYGLMANVLARKSLRRQVIGVDFDERKIAVARSTAAASENVAFELGDLFAWQGPVADAAVLADVVHYWDLEHQRRLIARAAASLREGGTLLFRDLCDARTWRHRLTAATERFATLSGHNRAGQGLHYGTREFYLRAFAEAGLTLCAEPAQLNVGSNYSAVLHKGAPCVAR